MEIRRGNGDGSESSASQTWSLLELGGMTDKVANGGAVFRVGLGSIDGEESVFESSRYI
jgi:hypothetical protein